MHYFCAILQDIPSLTAEAAREHPGVSYMVTAPLGLHELLVVCNVCIFFWIATVNCGVHVSEACIFSAKISLPYVN